VWRHLHSLGTWRHELAQWILEVSVLGCKKGSRVNLRQNERKYKNEREGNEDRSKYNSTKWWREVNCRGSTSRLQTFNFTYCLHCENEVRKKERCLRRDIVLEVEGVILTNRNLCMLFVTQNLAYFYPWNNPCPFSLPLDYMSNLINSVYLCPTLTCLYCVITKILPIFQPESPVLLLPMKWSQEDHYNSYFFGNLGFWLIGEGKERSW
jgi:hypothetical protein